MTRGALALTLALALSLSLAGRARAQSPTDDLAALSNREYVDYVRDRFVWLTGEGRSSHHLILKYQHQCKPSGDADATRACELTKAAHEQGDRVRKEGQELLLGLQHRLGSVPPWASEAEAALAASVGVQAQQPHP
jgi:hypothetical protein